MLASLSKKHYLYFMGIVFVAVSLWSTLAEIHGINNVISVNKILDPYMGKSLGGFLLMYIIGGNLSLFVKQKPFEKRKPKFHCKTRFSHTREYSNYNSLFIYHFK